ncbi:hypothetical protein EDB84DRAFT_1605723 [Lactarius hengduanensis]|nr:hypothetical protein EDB84DRAFT_1605723 [Lactarius hengduanensis]
MFGNLKWLFVILPRCLWTSLHAWLTDEEALYAVAIQEQLELFKKWGPRDDAVDPTHPHPTHVCGLALDPTPSVLDPHWVSDIWRILCNMCIVYSSPVFDFSRLRSERHRDRGLFHSAFQYPHRVQRVGINCESSFESTLLKRGPGCEVWGYDYSVNSVRTLSSLPLPYLLNWTYGQWGPEITGDPEVRDRAHFKPFALGGTNNHEDHDNPKCWTLDSLMDLNGEYQDTRSIDILKIDIEGGEFDGLTTCSSEIYAREGRENFEYFARWWASLEAAGLRPFWTEPNLVYINLVRGVRPELAEYSFIDIRGNHALVNEAFN